MKRFIIVLVILLSFSSVFAHDFNFELSEDLYSGGIGGTNGHSRVKGYYDSVTGNWYVYMPKDSVGGQTTLDILQYDSSWTETDSDTENCEGGVSDDCYDVDCNYVIEDERYFQCLGREDDGSGSILALYQYHFDNSSFTTIDTRSSYLTFPSTLAVSNRYVDLTGEPSALTIWNTFVGPPDDLTYTLENDLTDTGSLDIPSSYHQPNNVQVVYCNDMYVVFVGNSSTLFGLIYDLDLEYQNVYSLKPSGWTSITYGIDSIDDALYLSVFGDDGSGVDSVSLQSWSCNDDYSLTEIYTEEYIEDYVKIDNFDYDGNDVTLRFSFEDSSSPIQDDSVYDNDGVYNGGEFQGNGEYKYSLGFDGSDDYVNVTDSTSLNIQGSYITIGGWFYWDNFPSIGQTQTLIDKWDSNAGYMLRVYNNSGTAQILFQIDEGSTYHNVVIEEFNWYQIMGVYNGTHLSTYLNGSLVDSTAFGTTIDSSSGLDLYVGSSDGSSNFMDGNIDELLVFDEELSSSEISSLYNFYRSNVYNPYLTKNDDGVYYLFYEHDSKVKVAYEDPCYCSEWTNTTECNEEKIKQTRTCNPDSCDTETQTRYIDSDYCSLEYNRTLGIYSQEFEKYIETSECESGWIPIEETSYAECSPNPIEIPTNCQNLNVSMVSIGILDNEDGCDKGNYTLGSCNPSYDCEEQTYSCLDSLNYLNHYDSSYIIGEKATGKATMTIDNVCRCSRFILGDKVDRFKVTGSLIVSCDIACENEWYCLNEDYKAQKQIDCSISNETFCEYGCSAGECLGIEGSSYSPTNVWDRYLVNPNKNIKFVYALSLSCALGFIGMIISHGLDKKNKHGGLLFLIMFGVGFTLFILVGWIPAIVIFVMVFFVGIYLLAKNL